MPFLEQFMSSLPPSPIILFFLLLQNTECPEVTEELDSHENDGEYEEEEDDEDGDSQQEHCCSICKYHCVALEGDWTTGTRSSYREITGRNQNQPLGFIVRTPATPTTLLSQE